MAILYIAEYSKLGRDDLGNMVPVGKEPAVVTQIVTYSTLTQSAAFNSKTRFIRVISDAEAHIKIGSGTQTAVTDSSTRIVADAAEYFGVRPGHQLGAIQ